MKNKKVIAILLVFALCLPLLISCGASDAGSDAGSTTPPASDTPSVSGFTSESISSSSGSSTPIGQSDPEKKYAETITILTDGLSTPHLDPSIPGTATLGIIDTFKLGWDRLIFRDTKSQYLPMLATEWSTEDLQTWTFKLRDDVYFHNGEKFTAHDVVYTIGRMTQTAGTMGAGVWGYVDSVTALDDYTVAIVLSEPNVEFEFYVSQAEALIVNEKAINDDPTNGHLIGTGAYRIAEFYSNDYWVMERNDNYWQGTPITKTIIMRQIAEGGVRTMMLLNGEADFANGVQADDLDLFLDNPEYEQWVYPLANPFAIGFNMIDPVTGDKNFRLAVASAVNKSDMAATTQSYYYVPEDGVFGPYGMPIRNTGVLPVPEDLEKAKEYLEASSYKGETVKIVSYLPGALPNAEIVQQQLNQIGIKTEIVQTDPAGLPSFVAWDNNTTQLLIVSYAIGLNESGIRALFYPRMVYNRSRYENQRVTELFDQAQRERDTEKRKAIHYELQQLIADDLPGFVTYYAMRQCFALKGFGGVETPPDNFFDYRYAYREIE